MPFQSYKIKHLPISENLIPAYPRNTTWNFRGQTLQPTRDEIAYSDYFKSQETSLIMHPTIKYVIDTYKLKPSNILPGQISCGYMKQLTQKAIQIGQVYNYCINRYSHNGIELELWWKYNGEILLRLNFKDSKIAEHEHYKFCEATGIKYKKQANKKAAPFFQHCDFFGNDIKIGISVMYVNRSGNMQAGNIIRTTAKQVEISPLINSKNREFIYPANTCIIADIHEQFTIYKLKH